MTEVPKPKTNYQSAKPAVKAEEPLADAVAARMKKIDGIKVTQTKPGLGKRIKESFGGQDLKSVGLYLLLDVVIPSTRDLLFDLVKEGAHRSIYGDTGRRSSPGTSSILGGANKVRTSYSTMSSALSGNRRSGDTNITSRQRSQFDFSGLVLDDRTMAQEVLERMTDAIEEFGVVTVGDFYDLMEVTGNGFTDRSFGWDATTFRTADIKKVREGWILEMADPRPLKQ